ARWRASKAGGIDERANAEGRHAARVGMVVRRLLPYVTDSMTGYRRGLWIGIGVGAIVGAIVGSVTFP
ncbi:MAG: hypothetical protein ACREEC_04590, partial [Thermoplasmata archaeon]